MEEKESTQINNGNNLKTVKTYMSDMADTVRQNEISVIKVALAEQNKHEREDLYRKIEGTPKTKFFWALGGIIIIACAIYGTYYLINQKKIKDTPAPIIREESIISYDSSKKIVLKEGSDLSKIISDLKKDIITSSSGNIDYIKIYQQSGETEEIITTKTLFEKLKLSAPASLVRSLSDSYMIGMYTKSVSNIPDDPNNKSKLFIIFQSDDYEYSYAGMLDWEKTMVIDMLPIFNLETGESNITLSEKKWNDIIVNNKDARVSLNENNKPILYYLFIDKNNLIITESTDVIKEIYSRLIIKNMKPL